MDGVCEDILYILSMCNKLYAYYIIKDYKESENKKSVVQKREKYILMGKEKI